VKEIALALAIREHHQSYSDLNLKPEDRFRESVRDICGLFVTITDSRIYLLHQTAKEFLIRNDDKTHPQSVHTDPGWKHSLRPQDSHQILTEICMQHLLFAELEAHPLENDAMLSQYVGSHVFLDYSAKHWTTHLHGSNMEVDDAATQTMLRLCDSSSKRCMTWFRIYWTSISAHFPTNFTTLMIASYFGLAAAVKHLLELNGISLNSKDGTYGQSALSWAAGNGFNDVVKLLIEGVGRRFNGIKLPLKKRAQVDSMDICGRTPLSWAAKNGHEAVVKLLVKKGATVDSVDTEFGQTPLSYAAENGYEVVVKLLVEKGAAVDRLDTYGETPLSRATEQGHKAVVKLLSPKASL